MFYYVECLSGPHA